MASLESETDPLGYDADPSNEFIEYYQAKDGKWYTYQDRSIVNRRFLAKTLELDKLKAQVYTDAPGTSTTAKKKKKKKKKSSHASTTNYTPRHSDRVREPSKAIYEETREKVQQTHKTSSDSATKPAPQPPIVSKTARHTRTWEDGYQALTEFHDEKSHCNVPQIYQGSKCLSRWVCTQRKLNAKKELPLEQKQKLDALGFNWLSLADQQWMEKYYLVKEFYAKQGHFKVGKDNPLNQWVRTQRHRLKINKLDAKREELLREIKFFSASSEPLSGKKDADNASDEQEIEEEESDDDEEDDACSTSKGNEGCFLGGCGTKTKSNIKPPKLNQTEEFDRQWMKKYALLQKFREQRGHFRIPGNDGLCRWANCQRNLFRSGGLNAKRVQLLRDIKYLEPRSSPEPLPDQVSSQTVRVERDHEFDEDNTPIKVLPAKVLQSSSQKRAAAENENEKEPSDEDDHFPNPDCVASGSSNQGNKNNPELSQAEKYERQWMNNYALLKEHYAMHKHFNVPGDAYKGLPRWAKRQREEYNNNNLKPKREDLLRAINFPLEPRLLPQLSSDKGDSQNLSHTNHNDNSDEDSDDEDDAPAKSSVALSRRKRAATENVSYKEDGQGSSEILRKPSSRKRAVTEISDYLQKPSPRKRAIENVSNEKGRESEDDHDISEQPLNGNCGTATGDLSPSKKKSRQPRSTSASTDYEGKSNANEPSVPIQNNPKAGGELSNEEVVGTKLNVFGRLMPLIVKLHDTVGMSRLMECSNFLQEFLQEDAKDSGPETTAADAKSHLLHQAFQLQNSLEDSPKSRQIVSCCELYFLHLLERAATFKARESQCKRRKVAS